MENVLTVLIFLHVIYKCILSQNVQNYRPTHEQTNILLDQPAAKTLFFSHITCSVGGGGLLLSKLFA